MRTNIFISVLLLISCKIGFAKDRVLIIGDSHSYGPFGEVLDAHYRKQGMSVSSYASCGSSPSTWVKTSSNFKSTNCGFWSKDSAGREVRVQSHKQPSMMDAINKANPRLTVVSLGTNILSNPANINQELKFVDQMIARIKEKDSECVWIGPPDLSKNPFKANLAEGVSKIKKAVEDKGCKFIDSRSYTKYPAGKSDGIHYSSKDSRQWGVSVAAKLPNPSNDVNEKNSSSGNFQKQKTSGTR